VCTLYININIIISIVHCFLYSESKFISYLWYVSCDNAYTIAYPS